MQTLARGESGLVGPVADVDSATSPTPGSSPRAPRHPELTIDRRLLASGAIVRGDFDGLWRVIENLLENAARHGRPAGHVRRHVAATGDPAVLVVDDDARGSRTPNASASRRFARGPGATAAGSGLGFAIVDADAGGTGRPDALGLALGGLQARVTIRT